MVSVCLYGLLLKAIDSQWITEKNFKRSIQCSKWILYIRSTMCRSEIFWCSPLGRAVCLPLNTTRPEKCKPDGLKVCEKYEYWNVGGTSASVLSEWEWSPVCVGLCLRCQLETATSSWKSMTLPQKVRYKWKGTFQTVRFSFFF